MSTQGFPNPQFPQPPQYPQYPPPGYQQYPPPSYPAAHGLPYAMPYSYWPALARPRVWTVLTMPFVAMAVAFLTAVVSIIPFMIRDNAQALGGEQQVMQWLARFGTTYAGLLVLVLPFQLVFGGCAVAGALCSPERIVDRLGLRKLGLPVWAIAVLMLGTPLVGWLMMLLFSAFPKSAESEHIKLINHLILTPTGGRAVLLYLLIALMPGVCEELLFRGYVQRRLLRRWHLVPAIALTSVLFAAAHMDPVHAIGVLPIGVWLGIIAWRSDSTWPSIACHVSNNAFAIILGRAFGGEFAMPSTVVQVAVIAAIAVSFLAAVAILIVKGKPAPPPELLPAPPMPQPYPYAYAYPYPYPPAYAYPAQPQVSPPTSPDQPPPASP